MAFQSYFSGFLFLFFLLASGHSAVATLTLHTQSVVEVELVGYDGLSEIPLFNGGISSGGKQEIDTTYQGLALLRFTAGQSYPVLIGDQSFRLDIASPAEPPAFTGSGDNLFFYSKLAGIDLDGNPSEFARLLLQAKQLLESTFTIPTIPELKAKKQEIHAFVRDHYESIRHSDIVRRLVAQYFMMHEYIDFHTVGTQPTDIKDKFQREVLDGVARWLEILHPHIPEHEVLNYIVSLYYQRSMVSLAALIAENFQSAAYCPGAEKEGWRFPGDLVVAMPGRGEGRQLATIKDKKLIAFVSDDCPVSMVEIVIKARELADRNKDEQLIVAPLQQLSEAHLLMNRMVHNGNMLFIDDEQWRIENLAEKIRLPLFIPLGDDLSMPVLTSIK